MMVPLLLAASLLASSAAMAEPPANCAPARITRLEITSKSLRIAATADVPLYPSGGLGLVLTREPETADGAALLDVVLPGEGFTLVPNGTHYQAAAGQGPGGITDVKLQVKGTRTKISVRGTGLDGAADVTTPIRLVVVGDDTSAGRCARS